MDLVKPGMPFGTLKLSLKLPHPVMAGEFDVADSVAEHYGRTLKLRLSAEDAVVMNSLSPASTVYLLEMTEWLEIDRDALPKRSD